MDDRKEEVLRAEGSILRLGREAERMGVVNTKLEEVTTQLIAAQEEVREARKDILSFAESSASMNKRTEELVGSLNLRYEAVENRLRGIDLEITTFRKGIDVFETRIQEVSKVVQEVKEDQEHIIDQQGKTFLAIIVVMIVSIIGVALTFL